MSDSMTHFIDLAELKPGTIVHVGTASGWYYICITNKTEPLYGNTALITGVFVTTNCEFYRYTYRKYAEDGYCTIDPEDIVCSRYIELDDGFTVDITKGRLPPHSTRQVTKIIVTT